MLGRIAESNASEGVRRVVKGIGQKLKSIHPLQKKTLDGSPQFVSL